VEETGRSGKNHRSVASHWQTLLHNAISSRQRHERGSNSQQVKSALGHFGSYLHNQIGTYSNRHLKVGYFGTCHGQIGTSIKHNLVIITYLYKNKKRKLDLIASTKYNGHISFAQIWGLTTLSFALLMCPTFAPIFTWDLPVAILQFLIIFNICNFTY
jgi:hypothetical protein